MTADLACVPLDGPLGYFRAFAYDALIQHGPKEGLSASLAFCHLASVAGDRRAERAVRFITVFALHEMREFDEAIEVAERLLADCERDGAIYDQAKALSVLSGLRYLCGDVELAMDNLAAAMFIVRTDVPLDNWAASALVSLANTAMAVELFEVAEEGFRRCVDYGVLSGSVLPLAYGLLNGAINHLQWGMRLELLGHSGMRCSTTGRRRNLFCVSSR